MTVTADPTTFPVNIVAKLKANTQLLDADLFVTSRPLRDSDPFQAVGISASLWSPEEDSYEMKGVPSAGRSEPTLARYRVTVQALVKNMDEETGIAEHATLSKMIRGMLYRSEALRVQLATLVWTDGVSTERAKRWGVVNQRYLSNEIGGVWHYLSVLEYWLETETV